MATSYHFGLYNLRWSKFSSTTLDIWGRWHFRVPKGIIMSRNFSVSLKFKKNHPFTPPNIHAFIHAYRHRRVRKDIWWAAPMPAALPETQQWPGEVLPGHWGPEVCPGRAGGSLWSQLCIQKSSTSLFSSPVLVTLGRLVSNRMFLSLRAMFDPRGWGGSRGVGAYKGEETGDVPWGWSGCVYKWEFHN